MNMDGGVSPNQLIKILETLEMEGDQRVVPMLWGQPGIGKSEAVQQYADCLRDRLGREVIVHDVRLTLYSAVDLKGLPVPNEDKTESIWLRPEIFKMDSDDDKINILFLDELSSAVPQVLVASYQLILNREVAGHRLPDNTIIICAGNRKSDRGVVNKMPSPLANRMMHLNITFDIDSWRDWAFRNKVDDLVIGFISARPDRANTFEQEKGQSVAFATPRSWAKLSEVVKKRAFWDMDEDLRYNVIEGLIGSVVHEFLDYSRVVEKAISFEKIVKGEWREYEFKHFSDARDIEFYLYSMIVGQLANRKEYKKGEVDNVVDFIAEKFSGNEMITLAFGSILTQCKGIEDIMINNNTFAKWLQENDELMKKIDKMG